MKDLTLRNIAASCGGTWHGPKELLDREVLSVTTDSRKAEAGCLFIPIKGEKADGHDYIAQVMEKGALATLTEHAEGIPDCPYILVESTTDAIQKIAGFYRRSLGLPVVGITGSVGKTSTKEMIASVLSRHYRVLKTAGNFNNNIGLPLTVFRLTEEDEIDVLEMGINHFGEMTDLADTAEPDIMVITNIGTCHLEFLGDRDGVFRAKTECFDYIRPGGTVILNGEDDKLVSVREVNGKRPVFYGFSPRFRVYADEIVSCGLKGSRCTIHIDEDAFQVTVPSPGKHMILNALAGAAVGSICGLSYDEIREGIESMETLSGRFHLINRGNLTIIDDCYNANPMSMKASLGILAETEGRKTAVLGDMGELGPDERMLHREVGEYAAGLPIDCYVTVGELSKEIAGAIRKEHPEAAIYECDSCDDLIPRLKDIVGDEGTVLVKASHFMNFPRIVEALAAKEGESV